MRVAVLSDIHSNAFALRAVLRDVKRSGISEIWLAGDTFGYYPWAAEAFGLLTGATFVAVLGNHDQWVAGPDAAPDDLTGSLARLNADQLALNSPTALDWLAALRPMRSFTRRGWRVVMAHGTPVDALDGRYYPDDLRAHVWLPREGEILILGQTHYPLLRGEGATGLLLNPGSVGQPRDGDPMPSWAMIDLTTGRAELRRARYDNEAAISALDALGWDERVSLALRGRGQRALRSSRRTASL